VEEPGRLFEGKDSRTRLAEPRERRTGVYRDWGMSAAAFSVAVGRCRCHREAKTCGMNTTSATQLDFLAGDLAPAVAVAPCPTTERTASVPAAAPVPDDCGATTARPKALRRSGTTTLTDAGNGLEPLLAFGEAARSLGISLRQFRRLVDGGRIAFVKVSARSPRVRPSELRRYLEASTVRYS